jgi:predicted dinucleotide-binding enzyme
MIARRATLTSDVCACATRGDDLSWLPPTKGDVYMKVAIIGSGRIGGGLGKAWAKHGHSIVFGARNPAEENLVALCTAVGAKATTLEDAVIDAEVVVLAMPYGALEDVLAQIGACTGKIIIDCTNAVGPGFTLIYGHTTSSAEELQKKLPQAHVFKSFNAQGAENLANPVYDGVRASNFFCGDDPHGKTVLAKLVEDIGFEPIDAGPLKNARLLEPMMVLWIMSAKAVGSRDIAFKVLRR